MELLGSRSEEAKIPQRALGGRKDILGSDCRVQRRDGKSGWAKMISCHFSIEKGRAIRIVWFHCQSAVPSTPYGQDGSKPSTAEAAASM